jgi:hypothetical protein
MQLSGLLSFAAGSIHGGVAGSHFRQWWGYGAFFVMAAMAQWLLGLFLLALAKSEPAEPAHMPRARRTLFVVGALGNAAIVSLYVITRTTGIPFLGPAAGTVEAVAGIDVVSKAVESLLIWVLVLLWVRSNMPLREGVAGPAV